MSKKSSKELFEWYAEVALKNLKEIKKDKGTFQDCNTKEEFKEYMLNVFIAYYGLRCTCDDCMDWRYSSARGHYHHCQLYKFCHIVDRCLDWAEEYLNKPEVDGCQPLDVKQEGGNGVPPILKSVGIPPKIL